MGKAFGIPREDGICSLVIKALNLHEERGFVRNETRDLRFSRKMLEKPLPQILNDSLTIKHKLLGDKIKAELNNCPILLFQVVPGRSIQGPAIEQSLTNGGVLRVYEEDLYLDQVLRNYPQIKIKDATQKLDDWVNAATSTKKRLRIPCWRKAFI